MINFGLKKGIGFEHFGLLHVNVYANRSCFWLAVTIY